MSKFLGMDSTFNVGIQSFVYCNLKEKFLSQNCSVVKALQKIISIFSESKSNFEKYYAQWDPDSDFLERFNKMNSKFSRVSCSSSIHKMRVLWYKAGYLDSMQAVIQNTLIDVKQLDWNMYVPLTKFKSKHDANGLW